MVLFYTPLRSLPTPAAVLVQARTGGTTYRNDTGMILKAEGP